MIPSRNAMQIQVTLAFREGKGAEGRVRQEGKEGNLSGKEGMTLESL
jgi:hypothetical protein